MCTQQVCLIFIFIICYIILFHKKKTLLLFLKEISVFIQFTISVYQRMTVYKLKIIQIDSRSDSAWSYENALVDNAI